MSIAIVTGASSGMGKEFVIQLSEMKKFDEIWVIARRKDKLESLKSEVETPILPISLDLTVPESFSEYGKALEEKKPMSDFL